VLWGIFRKASDKLPGRRVKILVSEPWDFLSSGGENLLYGIIKASEGQDLLIAVTPFTLAGVTYDLLYASARYKGKGLASLLTEGKRPSANFAANNASGRFLLIGSLELLPG
jgi:hypothetical protein